MGSSTQRLVFGGRAEWKGLRALLFAVVVMAWAAGPAMRLEAGQGPKAADPEEARRLRVTPVTETAAILALTPRWGGSYQSMARLAAAAPVARNPRLKALAGYVDADKANLALLGGKLEEARTDGLRACELGLNEACLTAQRF